MSKHKKPKSCILGIDPGTVCTGYALIRPEGNQVVAVDFGCIRPPSKEELSERYKFIHQGVVQIINTYPVSALAVETQFVGKNVQSTLKLGVARGMAILAASLHDIPVFEYSPTKAKKSIVGTGKASKHQVQEMLAKLLQLPTPPRPEDAADALAIALCHFYAEATAKIGI